MHSDTAQQHYNEVARTPLNPLPEAIDSLRPLRERLMKLNATALEIVQKVMDGGILAANGPAPERAARPINGPGYHAQLMDIRSDIIEELDNLEAHLTMLREYL